MPVTTIISPNAYHKAILHCYKYQTHTVSGFLLGKRVLSSSSSGANRAQLDSCEHNFYGNTTGSGMAFGGFSTAPSSAIGVISQNSDDLSSSLSKVQDKNDAGHQENHSVNTNALSDSSIENDREENIFIADVIPLFHTLPMISPHPMLFVAFKHAHTLALMKGLSVVGYYSANEIRCDLSISKHALQVMKYLHNAHRVQGTRSLEVPLGVNIFSSRTSSKSKKKAFLNASKEVDRVINKDVSKDANFQTNLNPEDKEMFASTDHSERLNSDASLSDNVTVEGSKTIEAHPSAFTGSSEAMIFWNIHSQKEDEKPACIAVESLVHRLSLPGYSSSNVQTKKSSKDKGSLSSMKNKRHSHPNPNNLQSVASEVFGEWNEEFCHAEAVEKSEVLNRLTSAIESFAHHRLVDFDDHLEKVDLSFFPQDNLF